MGRAWHISRARAVPAWINCTCASWTKWLPCCWTARRGRGRRFSPPDSQWIGFFVDGKLKKISVHGGAPIALCDAVGGRGGDWGADGSIVFPNQFTSALYRVSAGGGTPVQVTHLDAARFETTH